jgi:hypothetical protein
MSSRKDKRDVLGEAIHRAWGDTPVRDGKVDMRVRLMPEDFLDAVRNDPAHCLFALAWKRQWGTDKALFFHQYAYCEVLDEEGNHWIERFIIGQTMRDIIAAFDNGDPVNPDGCFTLRAPTPSKRLGPKGGKKGGKKGGRDRGHRRRDDEDLLPGLGDDEGPIDGDDEGPIDGGEEVDEDEIPPEGKRPRRPGSCRLPREPLLVDAAERSGQGKVNWFGKRSSRARPSAAGPDRRPSAK